MGEMDRERLRNIKTFPSLVKYLRDELEWPIESDDFEDLTFEYEPEELGIDKKNAAKIQRIMQLRPLVSDQPWGVFFVKFEPKKLPVVALRRILRQLAINKRTSANKSDMASWNPHDLLFISNYGEDDERQITFAHFSENTQSGDLPTLRVLGWDSDDTALHLDHTHAELKAKLSWPQDEDDLDNWRAQWRSAFALQHREAIETSKQLALRLADLAHGIRARVNCALSVETNTGPLRTLIKAFKQSLIHDLGDDDFADMYAQTIAYGLLSARISRPAELVADNIADMVPVTNPFLRELMQTFLHLGGRRKAGQTSTGIDFDELGINDVVSLLREANMEAVLRDFDNNNPEEDPVIHFYELFLNHYDRKKKMQRGVFNTPKPVVSFIVRSVDEMLRIDFGLDDGLADTATWSEMLERKTGLEIPKGVLPSQPFVQILDPATGTGTFLVEVIDVIHGTMCTKWKNEGNRDSQIAQLWNEYVPAHLLPRIYGYELMMAPYIIAHMKIGLKLFETGYKFGSEERARIYLTNALEPANDGPRQSHLFEEVPALAHEAEAGNTVKRDHRFTVVIGNPPYAGHSSNASKDDKGHRTFIGELLQQYFTVDGAPLGERNPKWLNDDYVKFIRLSQSVLDTTQTGILGFITNHSYLDNPTFRGMRQSLITSFNTIRLLDLHGNDRKKERTPEGHKDENVFDIQQGVAIGLFENLPDQNLKIALADAWGMRSKKYRLLTQQSANEVSWHALEPRTPSYYFFPQDNKTWSEYEQGTPVPEIFPVNSVGIVTARDKLTIHFDKNDLMETVKDFAKLDPEVAREKYSLGKDVRDWKVHLAQQDLNDHHLDEKQVSPVLYRPFDIRWTYFTGKTRGFHCMPRPKVMGHMLPGNVGLLTCRQVPMGNWQHSYIGNVLVDDSLVSNKTRERGYVFPLYIYTKSQMGDLQKYSNIAIDYLRRFKHNLSMEFVDFPDNG